jgi:hypothetical protein
MTSRQVFLHVQYFSFNASIVLRAESTREFTQSQISMRKNQWVHATVPQKERKETK